MKDLFIETTKGGNYFANISRKLIENKKIRYLFPMNREQIVCYKINRQILKDLIDCGSICYNEFNEISEREYERFFEKRSVVYTKKLLEFCSDVVLF